MQDYSAYGPDPGLSPWSFSKTSGLNQAFLADSATEIREAAFRICDHMRAIAMPASLTSLGINVKPEPLPITSRSKKPEQFCQFSELLRL